MTGRLVYLDLETLGLTPGVHDVWEAAWAIDEGQIMSAYLAHSFYPHQEAALEVNGYIERFDHTLVDPLDEQLLYSALEGATVIGANPGFDCAMLSARWGGAEPWNYRKIDISSVAMVAFGLAQPPGMRVIVQTLHAHGHDQVPEPDHTAAGDVAALRDAYRALRVNYFPRFDGWPTA